jgi:hypothetical protein
MILLNNDDFIKLYKMKKLYTFLIAIILCIGFSNAQTPQGFKYQAVVRDNSGLALANKLVAIRLSLLLNSTNGTSVYSEVHNIATNDFGVANLNVGAGTNTTGNFASIDWGAGTYFLKTEADITNGSNFVFLGTSQLLSVPYAMYAAKSANAANDFDKDSLNEIQNLNVSNNKLSITKGNQVNLDADTTNEIQQLSLNNNNLQLNKNGGSVDLSKYDKDSQQLVLNGNILSITKGNSIVLSGAVDLDADPTNEIQNLSIKKDTISISNANYIILPKNNDADSTNEIQTLTYKNDTIQLSKSNLIKLPKDNDRDSLNELQTLQQNGNVVTMNKGGGSISVPTVTNTQNGSLNYATATGSNNIILTLTPAITQYAIGMTVNFKVPNSNTGHVTININNLGSKPLFKNVNDTLISDDLLQNKIVSIVYDGLKFQLLGVQNNNKYKITNYYLPGEVDRAIYDTTSTIIVPNDSILIYIGGVGFQATIGGKTFTIQVINDRQPQNYQIHVFSAGSIVTAVSGINFIMSKARVAPVFISSLNNNYIVPPGKNLCILSSNVNTSTGGSGGCYFKVNNLEVSLLAFMTPLIFPSGSILSLYNPLNGCDNVYINGYLFDK